MNKSIIKSGVVLCTLALIGIFLFTPENTSRSRTGNPDAGTPEAIKKSERELEAIGSKAARYEHFFRLLRDPKTNSIPGNIRERELKHARTLPSSDRLESSRRKKDTASPQTDFTWRSAGPTALGGRTRALGIDSRDPGIIIAGAVSGGIWRSTDGGVTWDNRTQDFRNTSVTSLAQDPQNPDTWYYTSGEFNGNSAAAPGAFYFGTGVYKSTDNGVTWNQLPSTSDEDNSFNSKYDTIERIVISPTTGSIFIASNGFGVYRSTDGQNFSSDPVVGTRRNQLYCDVAVASDGTLLSVISQQSFNAGTQPNDPGVFKSTDDGQSWTEITPGNFPSAYGRSVVSFAPSNPDVAYILVENITGSSPPAYFYKVDLSTNSFDARTTNLPDFRESEGSGSGYMELQGGYNMMVAVKPDDPDFVLVGGINLFRSRDGFATRPSGGYDPNVDAQKDEFWIGGYNKDNTFALYPDHHPDQHIVAFDPTNSDRMFSGHDGGVAVTGDVTAGSVSWTDRNEGYIVTQFYTSAIPATEGDNRLMGGSQDNGTPFFRFNRQQNQSSAAEDISLGDGGLAFFSQNHFYVSQQMGRVVRYNIDTNGDIKLPFAFVHPEQAGNQLFVHPYVVDPNDETHMFYPDGNTIYRNTSVDEIDNQDGEGASRGWEAISFTGVPREHIISAMEMSTIPADVLFYAASVPPTGETSEPPVVKRWLNASSSENIEDISISSAPDGAYINDIAVNPITTSEMLVVMSNYNIVGLYHTDDGGQSWTAVEGNLTGIASNPGPSIRSATIIPGENGSRYVLGTSTGVYSTSSLDGSTTTWGQDASGVIGYAVTEFLSSRLADGDIAAGTHGRGMFLGEFQGTINAPFITTSPEKARSGEIIKIQANDFQFSGNASDNVVTFNQVEARITDATPSELTVVVPAGVFERNAETLLATLSVKNGQLNVSTLFEILLPADFSLGQNYPNPFDQSSGTTIPMDLPRKSRVTMTIYNTAGQRVLHPFEREVFAAGAYTTPIKLPRRASGVYIYRIIVEPLDQSDRFVKSSKMTYINSN